MAELAALGPFEGLGLPLAQGGATLAALPDVPRVAVAPFTGRREAVSAILAERTGAGLPEPGRTAEGVVWLGVGQWLLEGHGADAVAGWLRGLAAVTDQSDAWAAMALSGVSASGVLARLVPLDLDAAAFPAGAVARSMLRHLALILISREVGFELMVPRSYAGTAVRELAKAMRGLAGRAALTPPAERL